TQGTAAAALLAAISGGSIPLLALCALTVAVRLVSARLVGGRYLQDPCVRRDLWLVPARDLLGSALWAYAYLGRSVEWRGRRYELTKDGRLRRDRGSDARSPESSAENVEAPAEAAAP